MDDVERQVTDLDGVATFYNLIFRRPVGLHVIYLCDSVSCWVLGYDRLRESAEMAPESAEAHYQLGLALRRGGHEQEAKKEFAIVERLNQQYRGGSDGRQPPPPPAGRN